MISSWAASFLPLTGAGFGVGFLVGLTGVGGGALMTPLLISSFGVSPQVAVGTDLLYASITKTAGSWRHHMSGSRRLADRVPARRGQHPGLAHPACSHRLHPARYRGARPLDSARSCCRAAVERPCHRSLSLAGKNAGAVCRRQDPPRTLATVMFGVALGLLVTLDLGRRRRHRRVGARGALSASARQAHRRQRRRPCRAADAGRRPWPFGARPCRYRAACRTAVTARSPASCSAPVSPASPRNGSCGRCSASCCATRPGSCSISSGARERGFRGLAFVERCAPSTE